MKIKNLINKTIILLCFVGIVTVGNIKNILADEGFNQEGYLDAERTDIFLSENNSLNITTNDKIATNPITYKTEALTVTELDSHGNIVAQIPWVPLTNPITTTSNGRVTNVFTITQADLIVAANSYGLTEMAQSIANALAGIGQCNLRIDSVMQVYHNGIPQNEFYGNVKGLYESMADLMNSESWMHKNSLMSHFNHRLVLNPLYGTELPEEGEIPELKPEDIPPTAVPGLPGSDQHIALDYTIDHETGGSGDARSAVGLGNPTCNAKNQPFFQTGNTSAENGSGGYLYNLKSGIPSKELVKNELKYDKWHAYADAYGRVCIALVPMFFMYLFKMLCYYKREKNLAI